MNARSVAAPIQFLFDYVSPYAYLASTQIRAVAARHGRAVEPVPVLFAGFLAHTGSVPPAEVPLRRRYLYNDVVRLAAVHGIRIQPPASHPFNPLVALRASLCVVEPDARWRLVDALFAAAWARSLRVDQPEVVGEIATAAGFDGPALVEEAATEEAKSRLRLSTEQGIAAGAFGVPTILADGRLFWGLDSLPLLERFLVGRDPLDAQTEARWLNVKPSAQRRPKTVA